MEFLDIVRFTKQSLIKNCLIHCNIRVVIYTSAGLHQCNINPLIKLVNISSYSFFLLMQEKKRETSISTSTDFQN